MSMNKTYGVGLFLLLLGIVGISLNIISDRRSFFISMIAFSVGFGLILASYVKK